MQELSGKYFLLDGGELWNYLQAAAADFREAYILSPFITSEGWQKIATLIDANPRKVKCHVLTRYDILSVALQQLDHQVLIDILKRKETALYNSQYQLKWIPNLHAKIYLFKPHNICVIGSSNLTKHGFTSLGNEMNVAWENSPTIFNKVLSQFQKYWQSSRVEEISQERCNQIGKIINLGKFKKLRDSVAVLRSNQHELIEFSRQENEHQSAIILKQIAYFLETPKAWNKLEVYLKFGKGKSLNPKIYFLIQNGFLEVYEDEKLYVSERGKRIIADVNEMIVWLAEIEPEIMDLFKWLKTNPKSTYEQIQSGLPTIEKNKTQRTMRWLASMKLVDFKNLGSSRQWFLSKKAQNIKTT